MYEYRQIIVQMRLGLKDRQISRAGLAGRKKCKDIRTIAQYKGWLGTTSPVPSDEELSEAFDKNKNKSPQSSVAQHHEFVKSLYTKGFTATVIYNQMVTKLGFKASYTAVQTYIHKYVKDNTQAVTTPLHFAPGDSAQIDFGQGPMIYNTETGRKQKTWFFLMVLSFSRHMYAEIVWEQKVETWIGCHIRAFRFFNGIPKKVIIDNAKCAVIVASKTEPQIQHSYYSFASEVGFAISACAPRDPQKKGRVEAGVKYIKSAFFPLREFKDLVDANQQLRAWVLSAAGNRKHGSTGKAPLTEFIEFEQPVLLPLPDVMPEPKVFHQVKVHKDCHVRYQKVLYSVPYQQVGEILLLTATASTIDIYKDHKLITSHCRSHKERDTITKKNHIPPNAQAFLSRGPDYCLEQAKIIGSHCLEIVEEMLTDPVVDKLKAVQKVISLKQTYGPARLEAACHRAIKHHCVDLKALRMILRDGLDYQQMEDQVAFDLIGTAYTSGKYCRDFSNEIH